MYIYIYIYIYNIYMYMYIYIYIPSVPKKTIHCLISYNEKPMKAISIK